MLVFKFSIFCFLFHFMNADSWKLIWNDEFDGNRLSEQNWDYDFGDGCQYGKDTCGWGNAELQYYTKSSKNSYVRNGKLVIKAIKERLGHSDYTSARLVTKGKAQFRYGKIEVRAKVAHGQGLWSAIWMLPNARIYGDWPKSGEIDILEVLGRDTATTHCTVHFGEAWNHKSEKTKAYTLQGTTFADGYHTFEIIWDHDRIEWFIDGNSVQVLTKHDVGSFVYPFNEDFHLIINLAVGGTWPQYPDASTKFPAKMKVDYIRVYKQN